MARRNKRRPGVAEIRIADLCRLFSPNICIPKTFLAPTRTEVEAGAVGRGKAFKTAAALGGKPDYGDGGWLIPTHEALTKAVRVHRPRFNIPKEKYRLLFTRKEFYDEQTEDVGHAFYLTAETARNLAEKDGEWTLLAILCVYKLTGWNMAAAWLDRDSEDEWSMC